MAKWNPMTDAEFERQLVAANRAGLEAAKQVASKATYDPTSNRIVLDLQHGVTVLLTPDEIEELKHATAEQLSRVRLLPGGLALEWEDLDVDISIPGLLVDLLGTRMLLSEVGKRGKGKSSVAKASASRVNGAKGGRPRKRVV